MSPGTTMPKSNGTTFGRLHKLNPWAPAAVAVVMLLGALMVLGSDRQTLKTVVSLAQANSLAVAKMHVLNEGQTARIKALEDLHREILSELRYMRQRIDQLVNKSSKENRNEAPTADAVGSWLHVAKGRRGTSTDEDRYARRSD